MLLLRFAYCQTILQGILPIFSVTFLNWDYKPEEKKLYFSLLLPAAGYCFFLSISTIIMTTTTVKATYPREIIYIISCQEVNTGRLIFFGLDDFSKYIFHLGVFEDFSDRTYQSAVDNLLNDESFHKTNGRFKIILGFGESLCRSMKAKLNTLNGDIEYNPDLAIKSAWSFIQLATKDSKINLKPVSLAIMEIKSWANFLNPDFIKNAIPVLPELSNTCQYLIVDFKTHFPAGIEHIAFLDQNAANKMLTLKESETKSLHDLLFDIPSHNGIIYLDIGNGFTTDFVYRYTRSDSRANIICFRQNSDNDNNTFGIAIASFKKDGEFILHTPTGLSDANRTASLISVVMKPGSIIKQMLVNFNPSATGFNSSGLNLIRTAKQLYVTYRT